MSAIPPNTVSSAAQAQLAQSQRAAENDAPREGSDRRSEQSQRRRADNREFVEGMIAAGGLAVDPEEGVQSHGRRKKHASHAKKPPRQESPQDQSPAAQPPRDLPDDVRARSAALLARPDDGTQPTPPPMMLDIEA